jgi:hypothetical protein
MPFISYIDERHIVKITTEKSLLLEAVKYLPETDVLFCS